ncbi:MAG: secretin N-terminal domain-containing protein [Candidatus Omnitrophica bacterium]|nr:secretin N-terminal domain-containing protein [Candidatus Omnitrophota bacterium]MDD5670661.1 secretin N-terminal domain-containing protein [Candidatus Omnitrophota bacterium]
MIKNKRLSKVVVVLLASILTFGPVAGRAQSDSESDQSPDGLPTLQVDNARPAGNLQKGLDKTIFLDLRDINVVDILKFLAIQGNLNIVTSKNVQGRSTLVLRNVSIRDALDIIVISNQLAFEIKNEIIYVMPEDEYVVLYGKTYNDKRRILTRVLKYAKPSYVATALQAIQSTIGKVIVDEDTGTVILIDTKDKLEEMNALIDNMENRLETKVVSLQYANVKDIEAQLKLQIDAKAVGSIYADERSNQIVVSAYPGRMDDILKVIKSLDKSTKAVLLEVRILQLTLNPKYDYGIDWDKAFPNWHDADVRGSFPINSDVSTDAILGTVAKVKWGKFAADDFQFQIKALKQVLNTKVLANPRLMVLNKEEAKINIGDRIPYVITTTTGTGNNTSVSEDIKFIDVGLSMVVSPIINDDGFVTLKIRPEISSQKGTLTTPTNNKIPLVNTTFVESTVIVQDGISVILGGLKRDDLTDNTKGWPVLMDMPVLGNLFKSKNQSYLRTEIVIIITPKIISGNRNTTDQTVPLKGAEASLSPQNVFSSSRLSGNSQGDVIEFDAIGEKMPANINSKRSLFSDRSSVRGAP